jgi:hypothetical protein
MKIPHGLAPLVLTMLGISVHNSANAVTLPSEYRASTFEAAEQASANDGKPIVLFVSATR